MTPELKDQLIDAALDNVAFDGWSDATFDAAISDTKIERTTGAYGVSSCRTRPRTMPLGRTRTRTSCPGRRGWSANIIEGKLAHRRTSCVRRLATCCFVS